MYDRESSLLTKEDETLICEIEGWRDSGGLCFPDSDFVLGCCLSDSVRTGKKGRERSFLADKELDEKWNGICPYS